MLHRMKVLSKLFVVVAELAAMGAFEPKTIPEWVGADEFIAGVKAGKLRFPR